MKYAVAISETVKIAEIGIVTESSRKPTKPINQSRALASITRPRVIVDTVKDPGRF